LGSMMSVPGTAGSSSLSMPLLRNDKDGHPGNASLPRTSLKISTLVTGIKDGYRAFQGGKFMESKNCFQKVLTLIPLVVTDSKSEAAEIKEMLEICREYITAIRIKAAMNDVGPDPVRSTELSAYLTHCNLQPVHLLLVLRSAMGTAFKHKNFITAAGFARRLLELPDMSSERNSDLRLKASKVLQKSEQMARNEHELNYDESTSFKIDCAKFIPIKAGSPSVKTSYTGSEYSDPSMTNKVCLTCGMCAVGVKTIGLVTGS
jgi:coatomer subunit alpha